MFLFNFKQVVFSSSTFLNLLQISFKIDAEDADSIGITGEITGTSANKLSVKLSDSLG